jgi:FtsP/CotA-like multicopper oxidase with cupredoxin domain
LTSYNRQFPGPLFRVKEGQRATVDVYNDTDSPEQLHWHGQKVPTGVDGASEEGTPFIPAHGKRRIEFGPQPALFCFINSLNNLQNPFGQRDAHGFKPTADIRLGVGFAAEMPGGRARGGGQVPLDDRKLLIRALDHKPMDRILTDDTANLTSEFLQTRHGISLE